MVTPEEEVEKLRDILRVLVERAVKFGGIDLVRDIALLEMAVAALDISKDSDAGKA